MLADMENTCRLCLASGDPELTPIQPYIGTLCGLALFSLDDRLPQKMCGDCVAQVENAASLRRRIAEVESLWSRCLDTEKDVSAELMVYCHICSVQYPMQSIHGHIFTAHGDHLDNCRLCQCLVTGRSAGIDSPVKPKLEIQIVDVRGGIDETQDDMSIINFDPRVELQNMDFYCEIDEHEGESTDQKCALSLMDSAYAEAAESGEVHKESEQSENSPKETTDRRLGIRCPICTSLMRCFETVYEKQVLYTHKRMKNARETPFSCFYCKKSFSYSSIQAVQKRKTRE